MTKLLLTDNFGNTTISIREYLDMLKSGAIVPYEKNRGGMKRQDTTIHIVDDFHPQSLGQITVSTNGHGTYKLADFHTRTKALLTLAERNQLSKHDLDYTLPLKVVNGFAEHMQIHSDINDVARHSGANYLANDDYAVARYIQSLEKRAEIKKQVNKLRTAEATMAIALHRISTKKMRISELTFGELRRTKISAELRRLRRLPVGKFVFHVNAQLEKKLIEGMRYWIEVITKTKASNKHLIHSDAFKRLMSNGSLYLLAMIDKVVHHEFTDRQAGWIAHTLASKQIELNHLTGRMASGSTPSEAEAAAEVVKLFKK